MEYRPDKNKEDAIQELLTCKNYILITDSELENQSDGCDTQYNVFYSCFMTAKGLMDYARAMWEKHLFNL